MKPSAKYADLSGKMFGRLNSLEALQANNTTKTIWTEYDGEHIALGNLARKSGVDRQTLYNRIVHLGWPVDKAISTNRRESK